MLGSLILFNNILQDERLQGSVHSALGQPHIFGDLRHTRAFCFGIRQIFDNGKGSLERACACLKLFHESLSEIN